MLNERAVENASALPVSTHSMLWVTYSKGNFIYLGLFLFLWIGQPRPFLTEF